MTRKHGAIILLVGLLAGPAAAAESDWPVKRGPAHEPVPYRFDANQWKQLPRDFLDDSPVCTLYSGQTYIVEADGTIEKITHDITRFSGRKGIERLGEYRNITYDPSYETLTLNEARVYKADGKAVAIEPKHVQLRDQGTDYQVYDRDKQLIISFPSLEVGDTIEVKWTTRGKNPEHQGQFFQRYIFGDDNYPVAIDEMRVCLPKTRTLKHATIGGRLDPDIREEGERRIYHWRATNRRQLAQDENRPPRDELRLAVACSTFESWDEVLQWKKRLRQDCWTCTPAIKQIVQELTRDLKTPLDKARALTYWVRRNVRYVSVGEKHDYTPHVPALVLSNRFGDCKDQSQLLAVMLREAGVPVALATLGTLEDGQVLESVPSPWGTHAILLVTLDGKKHWIDTTVSLAAWDYLPRDDRDRLCYVVDDNWLVLVRTPAMQVEDNRIEQTTQVTIGADGSSRSERSCVYHGAAALGQRSEWMEVPPGERRRLMTSDLQNAQSKARLSRLAIDEPRLRNFDQPVAAQITFEVPGHFSGDGGDKEGSITDSVIWGRLLSNNLDYDRKLPLDLYSPFESVHRYVIQLHPAVRFDDLPKEHKAQSKWGSFTLSVKAEPSQPRHVELTFHTRLEKARVDPPDFEAFRKFHEDVFKHYRVWLTVKPTTDADDATALEALLALAPTDTASATILAKLYQHEEKTKDARRVLKRARHYNPDDTTLLEMTVALVDDVKEQESAYQELIRRKPDEPRYSVALGESRVNRGDYAGARQVLEPIAQKDPASSRGQAHYQLARCAHAEDEAAKALKELEAATKADPQSIHSAAALVLKGQVHEKLGQTKEAADAYRQTLKIDPDSDKALEALVRLELAAKRTSEALSLLRRYAVAVESDVEGLNKAADYYLALKRYDNAFELAARARDIEFHAETQRIMGLIYLQRGDYKQAVFHLDRAEPNATVLEGLIHGNLGLGKLTEAVQQAEKVETLQNPPASLRRSYALLLSLTQRRIEVAKGQKSSPNKSDAWTTALDRFVCAEHLLASGESSAQVEALLTGAFVDGLELGPALALRGQLALEKGKLGKALADAERGIVLSPKEARGYYVRGRVRFERGQAGALADLSRAGALSQRKDAVMLHWLASALFRAGAHAEALAAQREAATLKPNDADIKDQLGEFEKASKD